MKIETYNKLTYLLDILEVELDKIAKEVGHISYKEFLKEKELRERLYGK